METIPLLRARGLELDRAPEAFGFLRTTDPNASGDLLRDRLGEDGYLYLPGLLARDDVQAARRAILERAAAEDLLDPSFPVMDGVLKEGVANPYFRPRYTEENPALSHVLYAEDGPMQGVFARLLDAPVRHFDFTWLRAVGPGPGTAPHCDTVYMGRGTANLYTAWTPFGDIPLTVGGLMVLEGSHRRSPELLGEYLKQDVDSFCANGPNAEAVQQGALHWEHWEKWQEPGAGWDGAITHDPIALRNQFGGRWLTSPEYRMGDVLIFTMRTVHASIDNATRFVRLSTDTRYQRADEAIDERWIDGPNGEPPIGHHLAAKRGKIC
jgi:hypothetical protein